MLGSRTLCFGADGEALESLRRYEIATVRRRGGGRGPPAAHLAADLDIVGPRFSKATETALPEAEAILVCPRTLLRSEPAELPQLCAHPAGTRSHTCARVSRSTQPPRT